MIPIETQIFRSIFPPSGSIPLEKLEAVPHIRQHINSIIDLASTEHGIHTPDESAALTSRVIELRDTPGPDGKIRTWRTIAEICGTTIDAVRHRYANATIRNSLIVEPSDSPTAGVLREKQMPQHGMYRLNNLDQIGHIEPFVGGILASESIHIDHPPKTGGARLDLSGEFTALRSVKLGGALDGCRLSVGPEREPSKHSPEDERILPKRERIKMELESIRVVIGILKQREQELQAEYDKLMEAA